MIKWLFIYLILINYIGFSLMHYDKNKAIKNERRIAEKNLWLIGFLGGSLGIWLAMYQFHHKNKKSTFKMVLIIITIIQLLIISSKI